ncbi:MAG: hypothetical protein V3S71_08400 [Acidobacteriota bacterium]
MERVENRGFAGAGLSLDIPGDIEGISEKIASPTWGLNSFQSQALTVEEYMIATATSVGGTVFERFPFFDTDDITHPENAWLMDITCLIMVGSPTAAIVTVGDPTTGSVRLIKHWDSFLAATTSFGKEADGTTVEFPYPITKQVPVGTGTPAATTGALFTPVSRELDPAAADNAVRFTARVRSAPDGVRVWGT